MAVKSILKITHDPDGAVPVVVLNYGERMDDWMELPGEQVVAEIPGLRVAGIDTAARGNEKHTLRVSKLVKMTSGKDSALTLLRHSGAAPRHKADIKIEVEGHSTSYFMLRNCTCESFPGAVRQADTLVQYVFKGGKLDEVPV